MKVIHVFKDFHPPLVAGITRYLSDVANECANRGLVVEVHVAGVRYSRRDVFPSGVIAHRHRELARVLSAPVAPGLIREASHLDADVVHVHMPNPVGEVGGLIAARRQPIVTSFHAQLGRQQFLEPLYAPLRNALLARSSAIIVASERLAAAPELASANGRVRVIPYGVSPRFTRIERQTHPSDTLRLLFVGRLVYYKGLDVLLRAAAQTERVTVTVVGDGPLAAALHALSSEIGLAGRVIFRGRISDDELAREYASHDAFVLPSVSRAEAFGLAMAEAMAAGLPVVSTRLGTATDWVNLHDESGVVVPPGSVHGLAAAFRQLQSASERERLSAGARERVTRLFSFQKHCDALVDVYRAVAP